MERVKEYLFLHICVMMFTFTSVFSKFAFANRSIYLLWSQLWAVTIFGERLTARNVAGLVIVLAGVVVVSLSAGYGEE